MPDPSTDEIPTVQKRDERPAGLCEPLQNRRACRSPAMLLDYRQFRGEG